MSDPATSPAPTHSKLAARRDRVSGMSIFSRYSLAPVHSQQPIVLVHGMVVSSAFLRPAAQLIGNYHRTYAPDLPGYGLSDKPDRTLTIEQQGDVLAEWMRALNIGGAVVAAVSLGTQFATALAARHPDLVGGLVLASPTMDPALRSRGKAMLHWLQELPHEIPMSPVAMRDYMRAGLRRADETFALSLADRMEDRLAGLDMPALVLHGERDHLVSAEWARTVADQLPYGRLIEVPGAAHAMNFSSPEIFARLVVSFASELAARRPRTTEEVAV